MFQKQGAMLELFVSFWRTTSHLQLVIWPSKCKTWLLLNNHRKWWVSISLHNHPKADNLLTHSLCILRIVYFGVQNSNYRFFWNLTTRKVGAFSLYIFIPSELRVWPQKVGGILLAAPSNSWILWYIMICIHGNSITLCGASTIFVPQKNGGPKFQKLFTGQSLPQFQRWFVFSKTAAPKTAQQKSPLGRIKTNCEGFKQVDTLIWENHVWTNSTQQKQWTRINFEWKNTSVV